MSEIATQENILNSIQPTDPELEAMLKAGVHLGHAKSKNHPSMLPFIFGTRNSISIIDLTKTKEKLAVALGFLKSVAERGGLILLVGTRPSARAAIRELAQETSMPYFAERWIGGTLTNFKVISKRVEHMEMLEQERASGGLDKYTKKERMKKNEELERLVRNFDGIRTLKRLPDALFVVDMNEDKTAVAEAHIIKISVVALADTNSNARLAEWPIPANNDALPAVRFMAAKVKGAILEGQQLQKEKESLEKQSGQ